MHMLCGVVTEHAQMYNHLTGMQNLVFYGTLFGMSAEKSRSRATALLEQLSLLESAGQKLGTYSTGMRQRLSLARAMMHSPKLLFLDEPTAGLDPQSTHEVNHLIQGLAETQGTTVFLCTHQLRYAQEICTSYGLIDGGRMLAVGQRAAAGARLPRRDRDASGEQLSSGSFGAGDGGGHGGFPELRRGNSPACQKNCGTGRQRIPCIRAPALAGEIYFALTQRQKGEAAR